MKGTASENFIKRNSAVTLAERLQGRFIDKAYDDTIVERTADYQLDNLGHGLVLTSKIVWTSENEYDLILEDISDESAELGLSIGDVMSVEVTEVTDEYYVSICSFNGQSVEVKLWFA
jgi:hypothetical protein